MFKEGVTMDLQKMKEILKREYGIESYEELQKAMNEVDGIDIGIFTTELRRQAA